MNFVYHKMKIPNKDLEVSKLGMGCWAIGGHFSLDGKADGWGYVDDHESIQAIHTALDMGVNFFDTADVYGTGHSEEILAKALKGKRDEVILATKFGFTYDSSTKTVSSTNVTPSYIRWACEESLKRLQTDHIDLYQLHCYPEENEMQPMLDFLDTLVQEGKILSYGPSTDSISIAQEFAKRPNTVSIQFRLNVLSRNPSIQSLCKEKEIFGINRTPLAHGLLSGKFNSNSVISKDDFRGAGHEWVEYFEEGRPKESFLQMIEDIKDVLTGGGRSLVQGALAWIWAESPLNTPITGFKTVDQVKENSKALEYGPLAHADYLQIESIIESSKNNL